ncbi:multiple monosaccharide ABC transporter permease [Myceligenerans xiligouense]|uniref:Xylose transport system permease protein XylH n=1 Tax=Myceligenerans xiligouense TaxID=253184 RepID=A0A3N4YPM1_9MICO|nr:multiple monosaccharide ABC transporter permease [Myceligenerans xiligouense]RPF22999.1 putative multiple sugar transport system permease protein [Myceligenerans xiligouense]
MTTIANLKDLVTQNVRSSGIAFAFIVIVGMFAFMTDGRLLSPGNLSNLVLQYSYILILAIGMLIVIVGGHIDLSVGSVVALTGAIAAVVVVREGFPWWVGALAAIAAGLLIGVWQGFWVAYVGIPAFIVTLAGMLLFRGLTLLVLSNMSLSPFPGEYGQIGRGFLNGLLGGYGYDTFTLVIFGIAVVGYAVAAYRNRRAKLSYNQDVEAIWLFAAKIVLVAAVVMWFAWQLATSRGLPIVLIVLAALIIAYTMITKHSIFGRHVYAIGGNLAAAQLSGVRVKRVNFLIFLNMGFLASIAGIVFSSRSNAAQPGAGEMFELDAIAACFIGGAAVTGGIGTIPGAMIGGLIMAVMSNGMSLLGVDQSVQQVVKGLVLLLAVGFDIWNKKRAGARTS